MPDNPPAKSFYFRSPRQTSDDATRYSLLDLISQVIASPDHKTYEKLLADPQANPRRGYLLVFISGTIASVTAVLIASNSTVTLIPAVIGALILGGALQTLFFAAENTLLHWVAQRAGGTDEGAIWQVHYLRSVIVALIAPLLVVTTPLRTGADLGFVQTAVFLVLFFYTGLVIRSIYRLDLLATSRVVMLFLAVEFLVIGLLSIPLFIAVTL